MWFATLMAFFATSTLLGRVGAARKAVIKREFEKGDARDAWQVLANGGVATAAALGMWLLPDARWLYLFAGGLFQHLLRGASVARSPLSAYRKAQVKPYEDAVTVSPETFAVALKSNNTAFRSDAVAFTSQAAANDYVARTVWKRY